jgi:hypothetical protein
MYQICRHSVRELQVLHYFQPQKPIKQLLLKKIETPRRIKRGSIEIEEGKTAHKPMSVRINQKYALL